MKQIIDQQLSIKTKPSYWVNTNVPVIIPLSIYSSFHEGDIGSQRVKTLIELVKINTKGKKTILLCDWSHLHAHCLFHENNLNYTKSKCIEDAVAFHKKI